MALMPGADHRLLARQTRQPLMQEYRQVCYHTMVGTLAGTRAMFEKGGTVGTESHFGVGGVGEIEQWVDTARSADANYLGSSSVISVETADHGPEFPSWNTSGDNVPPWTDAQLDALARIAVWAHQEHGVPLKIAKSVTDTGLGWHRMGVPGNGLPAGLAGTKYQWSRYPGKVCPGDARIAQMPEVLARAKKIVAGDTGTDTSTDREDDGMRVTDRGNNWSTRTIKPGETARLKAGDYYSMCAVEHGEWVEPSVFFRTEGTANLVAACRVVDYLPDGNPVDDEQGSFWKENFTSDGGTDGHIYSPQPYHVWQKPREGGSLRLQFFLKNIGSQPIDVTGVEYTVKKG